MSRILSLTFLLMTGQPALASAGGTLELYVYPASYHLDWSSPVSLLYDFLGIYAVKEMAEEDLVTAPDGLGHSVSINRNYYSAMGHTIGHISCTLSDGSSYEKWSSYWGQDDRKVDLELAMEGSGAGSLFYDFVDGYVRNGEINVAQLVYINHERTIDGVELNGSPRHIRVNITAEQCHDLKEMVTFLEGFRHPPGTTTDDILEMPEDEVLYFTTNLDVYDSYQNRMATGTGRIGGGCSNYVVAMFKMVGLYSEILDKRWTRRLSVSESLIGGSGECGEECDSVSSLAVGLGLYGNEWLYEGYPSRPLALHDPLLIWNFIGNAQACLGVEGDPFGAECTDEMRGWIEDHNVSLSDPMVLEHTHNGVTTERAIPGIELAL